MRERQGAAVIIVLGLVAITLALSYAVLRSQSTSLRVQQNAGSQISARQAALTGLSVGLRAMHEANWSGVDTTLARQINLGERFEVAYATGDPELTAASPEYADLPFRVTLTSTGFASDPATDREITHTARAVVRLIPRQLSNEAPGWAAILTNYTLYQWGPGGGEDRCRFEVPFRMEGRVRMQGRFELCEENPAQQAHCERYLRDLNLMRVAGQPDYRPFNGPVELDYSRTDATQRALLSAQLGVAISSITSTTPSALTAPSGGSYRIYPGGRLYTMTTVPQIFASTTFQPDPQTNPLGICYRGGSGLAASLLIGNDVTIRGSLFTAGDVNLGGTNIRFIPVSLPALYGADRPVQLPVIATGDDFVLMGSGSGSIDGAVVAGDYFDTDQGLQNLGLAIQGRVVARQVDVAERNEWDLGGSQWDLFWTQFNLQLGIPVTSIPYFPRWLETRGLRIQPLLTVRPELSPVRYYIPQSDPLVIYAPHADDDGGLRWELLSWSEG
jgi:hypothetical protein